MHEQTELSFGIRISLYDDEPTKLIVGVQIFLYDDCWKISIEFEITVEDVLWYCWLMMNVLWYCMNYDE